jgi:deazaflavin-dependent oxidoreductase (nitroreductase family)
MDTQEFNRKVIEEFRANAGVMSGAMADIPLLLLTTTGARSGLERVNPLAYLDNGDHYIIIASFAGAPNSPPWFHNLVANPDVGVAVGAEQFNARAEVVSEPERTELYAKVVEQMPVFGEYQERTERTIPLVRLTRH